MSDAGSFPIGEAQIVALFMESVTYGVCSVFDVTRVSKLTLCTHRNVSGHIWALHESAAARPGDNGRMEEATRHTLVHAISRYPHVCFRYHGWYVYIDLLIGIRH